MNTGRFNGKQTDVTTIDTETFEIKHSGDDITPTNLKKFIDSLEEGDIILTYGHGSIISESISKATKSQWSHATYYIGGRKKQIIEATLQRGVAKAKISRYLDGAHRVCVLRSTGHMPIPNVTELIKSQLGKSYSIPQIIVDAFAIIYFKITNRDIRKTITFDLDEGYSLGN